MPEDEAQKILGELEKRESDYMRLQRTRMTADDFDPLTIIGRGAFGEVKLALHYVQLVLIRLACVLNDVTTNEVIPVEFHITQW